MTVTNPLNLTLINATGYLTGQLDWDDNHIAQIADSMRTHGWQGPPLVVLPDYAQAYSGTHRLAAADQADLDTVPAVTLHDLFEACSLDLDQICADEHLSYDDRPQILAHLPESVLADYALDDIC